MTLARLTSNIDKAKVYASGATITRIANLELVAGEIPNTVEIPGLPLALEDSSVRARVETESSETLAIATDIRIGLVVPPPQEIDYIPPEAEIRQAKAAVKKLENLITLIDAEIEAIADLKIPDRPHRDPQKAPPPSPLAARLAIANFKEEQIRIKQKERRENKAKLRQAIEHLQDLEQEQKIASTATEAKPNELRKTVIVSLSYAGEKDNFTQQRLIIEYFVPGARWTPSYVCRLDSKNNTATITMRAAIAQNSGEDWLGVRLELSTALPQTWCELPELTSLRIGKAQPSLPIKTGWRQPPVGFETLFEDYDLQKDIAAQSLIAKQLKLPDVAVVDRDGITLSNAIPIGFDIPPLSRVDVPSLFSGCDLRDIDTLTAGAVPEVQEEETKFSVYLTKVPPNNKVSILQQIRAITGLGIKRSKDLVELTPVLIKKGIPKQEAENIITRLKQVGAEVRYSLEENISPRYNNDFLQEFDLNSEGRSAAILTQSDPSIENPSPANMLINPFNISKKRSKQRRKQQVLCDNQLPAGQSVAYEKEAIKETQIDRLAYSLMRLSSADNRFKRGKLYIESLQEIYLEIRKRQKAIVSFDIIDRVKKATNEAINNIKSLPAGSIDVRSEAGSFDYTYQAEGRIDLVSDGQFHSVAIASRNTDVNLHYVAVPRESTSVFCIAQLRNPLQAPLLAGSADIYVDGEYILGSEIKTVPAAGEMKLGLGVEQGIKVARNTNYHETRSNWSLVSLNLLHHQIKIDLANRLNRLVKIEVRERIPIADRNVKVDIEIDRVAPEWEEYNQKERNLIIKGGYRWQIDLPAKEETTLEVDYTIKTFVDKELIGGNRRE